MTVDELRTFLIKEQIYTGEMHIMNTIDELKSYLVSKKILEQPLPKIIAQFLQALENKEIEIPEQAKVLVIVTWLQIFASQFKIKVNYRNTNIPLTAIGFLFSPSGSGKDLTYNGVKKLFSKAMDRIDNTIYEQYKFVKQTEKELRPPMLEMGFSTSEGMLANIAVTHKMNMGEPFIYSGEFISEYKANPNSDQLLRDIIEISGTGEKQSKQLKSYSNQTGKITGCGLNSLFASDISEIYQNPTLLASLKVFFQKGLARRSSVVLIKEIKRKSIAETDFDFLTSNIVETEQRTYELQEKLTNRIDEICYNLLENNKVGHIYTLSDETRKILLQYKKYNEFDSYDLEQNTLDKQAIRLLQSSMGDKDFRAIKLAAAIALLKQEDELSTESLLNAIAVTEYLANGMKAFEVELNKNLNDIFVDYCNQNSNGGNTEYKAADLIKSGFLTQRNLSKVQISNLAMLANQIDKDSLYEADDETITHIKLVNHKNFTMTYKALPNMSKEARSKFTADNLEVIKFDNFGDIAKVLSTDCCFSGFTFKDGHRNNENLITKTNILVFDVDESAVDYEQFHHMIMHLNHHIAQTSNASNKFKYRIILELDREYDIPMKHYRKLIQHIRKNYLLDLPVDMLVAAQIFYGYEGRTVLTANNSGNELNLKDVLAQLLAEKDKPTTISQKEKKAILEGDYIDNFAWAINSHVGQRSLNLIRVINAACDYGATLEKCREIVETINNSFVEPLTSRDLEKHIFPHLKKKYD